MREPLHGSIFVIYIDFVVEVYNICICCSVGSCKEENYVIKSLLVIT